METEHDDKIDYIADFCGTRVFWLSATAIITIVYLILLVLGLCGILK